MTITRKALLSLLVSFMLFGVLYALAFAGVLDPGLQGLKEAGLLSGAMEIVLVVSFLLTVFLIVFLLFNLRQDPVSIIQNRIKRLMISLIERFYEDKVEIDWARWSRELELRREEIDDQLKYGLKFSYDEDINFLLDKFWDEFSSVIGSPKGAGISEEKLESILNRIIAVKAADSVIQTDHPAETAKEKFIEELEELEAVDIPAAEDESSGKNGSSVEDYEMVSPYSPSSASGNFSEEKSPDDMEISDMEEISYSGFSSVSRLKRKPTPDSGLFLEGRQYFTVTGGNKIEDLEVITNGDDDAEMVEEVDLGAGSAIEKRGGIHYVSSGVINSGPVQNLNMEFKNLVDSVLKS